MKTYETPKMEEISLTASDVIAASGEAVISYDENGREYLVGAPSDWWGGNE